MEQPNLYRDHTEIMIRLHWQPAEAGCNREERVGGDDGGFGFRVGRFRRLGEELPGCAHTLLCACTALVLYCLF